MTQTKCPYTQIDNSNELHEFITWYFQNVKQDPRPGQITSFIERSRIETYKTITPKAISNYFNTSGMYNVDKRSQRYRYTLKEEYMDDEGNA